MTTLDLIKCLKQMKYQRLLLNLYLELNHYRQLRLFSCIKIHCEKNDRLQERIYFRIIIPLTLTSLTNLALFDTFLKIYVLIYFDIDMHLRPLLH
mgnify:CR=1 FL=1